MFEFRDSELAMAKMAMACAGLSMASNLTLCKNHKAYMRTDYKSDYNLIKSIIKSYISDRCKIGGKLHTQKLYDYMEKTIGRDNPDIYKKILSDLENDVSYDVPALFRDELLEGTYKVENHPETIVTQDFIDECDKKFKLNRMSEEELDSLISSVKSQTDNSIIESEEDDDDSSEDICETDEDIENDEVDNISEAVPDSEDSSIENAEIDDSSIEECAPVEDIIENAEANDNSEDATESDVAESEDSSIEAAIDSAKKATTLPLFADEVKLAIEGKLAESAKYMVTENNHVYYQTKNDAVADITKNEKGEIATLSMGCRISAHYKKNDNIFNRIFEDIGCKSKIIKENEGYCKHYVTKINNAPALIEITTQLTGECIVAIVFNPKKSAIKPYLTSEAKSVLGLKA